MENQIESNGKFRFAILMILLFLHSAPLRAEIRIEKLRGAVSLFNNKHSLSLTQEGPLKKSGLIRTGRDSRLRIILPSGKMDLAPDTQVKVHLNQPNLVFLKQGHIRVIARSVLTVQSAVSLIKAKAKSEVLAHVTSNSSEFYTQVDCMEGEVEVTPKKSHTLSLKPGDIVRLYGLSGSFAPTQVGVDEIRLTRRALGFLED